ncbi:hypothetical protein PRUPE_1G257000 [Prunus persica]|uniref:Uncharacterized protein n=1 Tax=Prunus persica TaxID=3760 RepID=A0A251R395_PRUPE|nr:hypothetical protein PRUPE_1G257000 [Prunus persica]
MEDALSFWTVHHKGRDQIIKGVETVEYTSDIALGMCLCSDKKVKFLVEKKRNIMVQVLVLVYLHKGLNIISSLRGKKIGK